MNKHYLLCLCLAIVAALSSCKKDKDKDDDDNQPVNPSVATGWDGTDDPSTVPSAVTFGSGGPVPASHDLIPKFPPIGAQGNYGTCVAWAAGYNMKSAIEGMDRGLSTGQLATPANQISARDLFTAIPDAGKGTNCNGTGFTDALDVLLNRGAATLQTVPYTSLNGCTNANLQSSWATEAANHKVKSYRKISLDVNSIKEQIANNVPVVFGAKLSDNFLTWNDGNVISSNTTYNQATQHSYHAMVIGGYDDNKGAGGAFRVINSWSPTWGDNGYIWVDYNFFVTQFCFGGNVYIAINDNGGNNPPPSNDSTITGSIDLASWAFADVSWGWNSGVNMYEREIEYNIYNIGDQSVTSNPNWFIHYIYYNAYDANDYGFLFFDEVTSQVTAGAPPVWLTDHWALNFTIQPGDNLGNTAFASNTIVQGYYVPAITGYYYLLIIADSYDDYPETDEQNNLFYTTGQYPVTFINGEAQRGAANDMKNSVALYNYNFLNRDIASRQNLLTNPYRTAVNKNNPNAYTNEEIRQMISKEKNSARWNQKLKAFKANQKMTKGKK